MVLTALRAVSVRHAHVMKQLSDPGRDVIAHKLRSHVLGSLDQIQSFRTERDFPVSSPFAGSVWTGNGLCREASLVVCKALASFGYRPVYRYNSDVSFHKRDEGSHAFVTFETEGRQIFVDATWRQWILDLDKITYESPEYLEYLNSKTPDVLVSHMPQIVAIQESLIEMKRALSPQLMSDKIFYFPLRNILGAKTDGIPYDPARLHALLNLGSNSLAHLPSLHHYLFGK